MLFIKPEGPTLTPDQAKLLDDEFFLFHPQHYFNSRIAGLLATDEKDVSPSEKGLATFRTVLGLDPDVQPLEFGTDDRKLQVAADAVALRHHVAETLMCLLHALTAASDKPGDARCVWLRVADGPTSIYKVVSDTAAAFRSDDEIFARLFWPPDMKTEVWHEDAARLALDWVDHARKLLTSDELSTQAANNKIKHGMAVSARNDRRIEFVRGPLPEDGQLRVSSFGPGRSVPIAEKPQLTFLSRPHTRPPRGIEVTSLQVHLPHVLAEAWLMAIPLAAIFHVAARAHFGEDSDAKYAAFPALPMGPTPEQLFRNLVLGTRETVTLPPDAGTGPRPSGVFSHESFLPVDLDYDGKRSSTVMEG